MGRMDSSPPAAGSHPLEMIPFFRRFPCSPARDLLYTFIWNCGLGTAFWLMNAGLVGRLPTSYNLLLYLVMANLIGYSIHGLFVLGQRTGIDRWFVARGLFAKAAYFTAVPTLGVIAGFQVWMIVFDLAVTSHEGVVISIGRGGSWRRWFEQPGWIVSMATTSIIISLVLVSISFWREREARGQAQLERERLRAERIGREATLANLRALQAQIEPHFLFNTLANVASLVDAEPAKAKGMLDSFIRFLRASLAATRAESTTLGAEAELIAAYLDALRVRMGARLRYAVDVAPELRGWPLAPMLLQPVVENAIRHGLEPKVEGGEIAVRARREGEHVVIEIRDTGVGFAPATRGGVGLTNLRDRLRGLHGDRATLTIGDNPGGGAVVTIRLPA